MAAFHHVVEYKAACFRQVKWPHPYNAGNALALQRSTFGENRSKFLTFVCTVSFVRRTDVWEVRF